MLRRVESLARQYQTADADDNDTIGEATDILSVVGGPS